MKKTITKKKQEGFTIIEVLIVLAIAGLIILIVFLAVPALQRNARNTQRNTDVSAMLGAMSEYVNNNNGKLPKDVTGYNTVRDNAGLSFYDPSEIDIATNQGTAANVSPTANQVKIRNFAKCDGNDAKATNATRRNVVAVYQVETSGAPQNQCRNI